MLSILIYGLIYTGSALMVYNIYRYLRFARQLLAMQGWEREQKFVQFPTLLLVCFLLGYLFVGLFGKPDIVVAAILFGGSVFVQAMILFIDRITWRIKANERLAADLRTAEESSRAKTNFLSTMSHEIRTPLNAIVVLNGLALSDSDLSDLTRERLEKMRSSADHLLTLINDILDMTRIESGQVDLAEQRFDMQEMLDQVNGIIDGQCASKGLTYRSERVGELDRSYVGDAMKLKQVLINILGNAVKFTPAPGTVSLTVEQTEASEDARRLRFTISDTGIGMDESFLPRLFTVFSQEDETNTSEFGGTGLGMAITKRIVDMMDGSIEVQSKKGVGTTFVVCVRLGACGDETLEPVPTEVAEDGSAAAAENGAMLNADDADTLVELEGLHVLMAEDIEINADILIDLLDMEGVEVDHAKNGRVCVDLFEQSEPGTYDAVLMDVRMPVMDGLEATKTIRALDHPDAKDVPIIALTANAFDEDVQHSLSIGMDAHLAKPIDPDLLYETIRIFVTKRRAR